jgi:hypothetical protein
VDELRPSHGQRSFKSLLSLPASIEGIPGSAPVGLTSFPRHVYEKNNDQSDNEVAITAPELRRCLASAAQTRNEFSPAKIDDIHEDGS